MILFFFYYLLRILRTLHSFPTRRSSDLAGGARSFDQNARPHAAYTRAADGEQPLRDHRRRAALARGENCWSRGSPSADRKSTRLNSSHQIISYAVFCLKKKNKLHINYEL